MRIVLFATAALLLSLSIQAQSSTPKLATSPADYATPGAHAGSIVVKGVSRWFIVVTPKGYSSNANHRLIIALHGANGGMYNMYTTRLDLRGIAEQKNYVLVFPNGQNGSDHKKGHSYWNADFCCDVAMNSQIDDVAFVTALANHLKQNMSIDAAKAHIVGFSNGGMLTQKIAAEASTGFSSFVSMGAVPGYYEGKDKWTYKMSRKVPIMLMHGTKDTTIAFNGGTPENNPNRTTLSFQESLRTWAIHNGCSKNPPLKEMVSLPKQPDKQHWPVYALRYEGCNAATVGVAVEGVAHKWLDVKAADFNGTLHAVEFFESH